MTKIKGIALLIALNVTFVYTIIYWAMASFAIIVAELGHDRGLIVAKETSNEIYSVVALFSLIVLILNFFLLKKSVGAKMPLVKSAVITFVGILVFIPFFRSSRNTFINYQDKTTILLDYLDAQTIAHVAIIKNIDTIEVQNKNQFITQIGLAQYRPGMWKYQKNIKIMLTRLDGSKDSILSNGQMFGDYNAKFFETKTNVLQKYFESIQIVEQ